MTEKRQATIDIDAYAALMTGIQYALRSFAPLPEWYVLNSEDWPNYNDFAAATDGGLTFYVNCSIWVTVRYQMIRKLVVQRPYLMEDLHRMGTTFIAKEIIIPDCAKFMEHKLFAPDAIYQGVKS